MKFWKSISATLLALFAFVPVSYAQEWGAPPLILVIDASSSMWAEVDGENKIDITRQALSGLIDGLPGNTPVGLVAYGHRTEGDCKDVEFMAADLNSHDKANLKQFINGLNPKGMSPIELSLTTVFDSLDGLDETTTVVLITDGLDNCNGVVCWKVKEYKQNDNFVLNVIGLDLASEDVSELTCAAQAGGGLYLSAANASELSAALNEAAR